LNVHEKETVESCKEYMENRMKKQNHWDRKVFLMWSKSQGFSGWP